MHTAEHIAEKTLILTRVFAAPRVLVFKAWVEPERAALWWGPQGFTTLSCRMDLRLGGAWRMQMRSPEGTIHTKRGIYREIEPPDRLVFTYAWEDADGLPDHETLVTLRFEDHGDKETKLTLHQAVFESPTACWSHRDGWTSCLERFAAWLAEG
jgi:uncharacterized protein YndB with AHSA1/START domain